MMFEKFHHLKYIVAAATCILAAALNPAAVFAASMEGEFPSDWPQVPEITAEAGIVMEANTGVILYSKNPHEELYPASITKIMTTLLALENSSLDETVTFSHNSLFDIDTGSSLIGGLNEGDQLTMEQCLYGIMLTSGNEAAYAVAEHVAGSLSAFVDMMNERAKELGCQNTHFVNSNGLHNEQHYTSAYDMALISQEALKNAMFREITKTKRYIIPPNQFCAETRYLDNHQKMLPGGTYEYDGCIGGKTGYTESAGQTLVTFAARGNIELICVVMKDASPNQFTDTASLLDYGFQNFQKLNIAENDTTYSAEQSVDILNTDILKSQSLLSISPNGFVVIPNHASWENLDSEYLPDDTDGDAIGTIRYTYQSYPVGSGTVLLNTPENTGLFSGLSEDKKAGDDGYFTINIRFLIAIAAIVLAGLLIFFIFRLGRRRRRRRRNTLHF